VSWRWCAFKPPACNPKGIISEENRNRVQVFSPLASLSLLLQGRDESVAPHVGDHTGHGDLYTLRVLDFVSIPADSPLVDLACCGSFALLAFPFFANHANHAIISAI
jgi:hypothetical protein